LLEVTYGSVHEAPPRSITHPQITEDVDIPLRIGPVAEENVKQLVGRVFHVSMAGTSVLIVEDLSEMPDTATPVPEPRLRGVTPLRLRLVSDQLRARRIAYSLLEQPFNMSSPRVQSVAPRPVRGAFGKPPPAELAGSGLVKLRNSIASSDTAWVGFFKLDLDCSG
jgi:hypothetical protein